ncbi:hypothetical protein JCM8097_007380 [Rhodosporidiobolus ruineniae]
MAAPSTLDVPSPSSPPLPTSPRQKQVVFADEDSTAPLPSASSSSSSASAAPDSSTSTSPTTTSTSTALPSPSRPPTKRRRSSLKQGTPMPYQPPKHTYQHPDPLLRRLRLRDGYGKEVDLQREFGEAKVVLFFFGATWPGSHPEPFDTVRAFANAHPHQLKVVYVSIDSSEQAYEQNTRQKPWLSMEWNDGSNTSPLPSEDSPLPDDPLKPLEPFLLAGDPDLEEDLHASQDPKGELYLRPYSRVFLAEKWTVLGVPNLTVYHPPSRRILSYHARFDLIKPGRSDKTWEKWSRGEKIEFSTGDLLYALRYSLAFAALGLAYLYGVRSGSIPDLIGNATASLTQNYLAASGAGGGGAGGAAGGGR